MSVPIVHTYRGEDAPWMATQVYRRQILYTSVSQICNKSSERCVREIQMPLRLLDYLAFLKVRLQNLIPSNTITMSPCPSDVVHVVRVIRIWLVGSRTRDILSHPGILASAIDGVLEKKYDVGPVFAYPDASSICESYICGRSINS